MSIFEFVINFIESFMFSYFLANYYNIDNKYGFISLSTFTQLCFLGYANVINNDGLYLSIAIISVMIILVMMFKKNIKFDYIYTVLLYNSFIIILALIGILISNIFQLILPSINESTVYYIKCTISKMFQILLTIFFVRRRINLSTSFNLHEWWFMACLDFSILSLLVISVYALTVGGIDYNSIVLILILSFSAAIFFRYSIVKIDIINKEKMDFVRMQDLSKYNNQKLLMLNKVKDEISATDHRMYYMLVQMEHYLETNQFEKLKNTVKEYRNMIAKYKIVVNTNNAVFDCLYSLKVNGLLLRGYNIESTICISCRNIYNDIEFVNFIIGLFDYFESCKTLMVSMQEYENEIVVRMIYRDGVIDEDELTQYLSKFLKNKSCWNMNKHQINGVRLIIDIDDENETFCSRAIVG